MMDLIDLGNLVFDVLLAKHGEIKESRMLFLYGITTRTRWTILSSPKWVLIEDGGVTKNFDDPDIEALNEKWKSVKVQSDYVKLERRLAAMRSEFDRPAPKDGDIWEFGGGPGTFRKVPFSF